MNKHRYVLLILTVWMLVGCSAAPRLNNLASPTPLSVEANVILTPTIAPSVTPTPWIYPRTIYDEPKPVVTPQGGIGDDLAYRVVAWYPDNESFALAGDGGVYLYQTDSLIRTDQLQSKVIVYSLDISPDGHYLVSDDEKKVLLWDLTTKAPVFTFYNHTAQVLSVAFSPDGKLLASGGADGIIYIVDVETKKVVYKLMGHTDWVSSVSFSSDGASLASGSFDETLRVWNLMTGENYATLPAHEGGVYAVAFQPLSNLVASGGADGMLRIWNASTQQLEDEFYGKCVLVTKLVYSPDGSMLAWGGLDGRINLRDTQDGNSEHVLDGHMGVILSLKFSQDGKSLLSTGSEGTAKLWDVTSLKGQ
jgi:WD40 repeat protein